MKFKEVMYYYIIVQAKAHKSNKSRVYKMVEAYCWGS